MVAFKKKIIRPGVFKVRIPKSKDRRIEAITPDRIKSIANTANKMLESGIKIPAPFAHKDKEGLVPQPLVEGSKKDSWDLAINGGFWTKFEVDQEDDSLIGIVEVPGEESDFNTPAGKVGKTVKETSIFLMDEWTDGLDRSWKDAPWHIALVTNPVEPDQEDFQKVEELALAMSFSMSDEINSSSDSSLDSSGLVSQIIAQLEKKLEINLPENTVDSNFLDRFLTVLTNLSETDDKESEDLTEKPEGSNVPSSPIAMANSNPDNLVMIESKANKLLESFVGQKKTFLRSSVETLVSKGKIGRKYADEHLIPQIDGIQMSLDDIDEETGDCPSLAIEMALGVLDQNVSLTDTEDVKTPEDAEVPEVPEDVNGPSEASNEDAEAAYASFM